ncbi:uncharacterized protein DMAD_03976 [Drosophila madeirensis]|uniref:Uncharacterized protein n=1 Tax=Drosophila madeirensis TaxID=30013 RepID=A0AAU9G990_DROMD
MFSLWLKALILPSTLYFAVHCFAGRYVSVENIQGDEETLFEYKLKLVGRDRLLNGTIIHHVDLDEDYDVGIDLWTYKNGKWVPLNVNLYQKPCYCMENTYATYFEKSIRDSNLPTGDNKCPFRKARFEKKPCFYPEKWQSIWWLYSGGESFK